MSEVRDDREAEVLAAALQEGRVPEAQRGAAMAALRAYVQQGEPAEPARNESVFGRGITAAADVGAFVVSAGVAEMVSGLAGASDILLRRKNLDYAVDNMAAIQDMLTFQPRTREGQELLQAVGSKLVYLERGADWVATKLSGGNPFAAAMIKTGLLGGAELAVPARGVKQTVAGHRRLAGQTKKLKQAADKAGIDLRPREVESSIIDAAQNMTPEVRAQNAPVLQQAMKEAADTSRKAKSALFDAAKEKRAFIRTRNVREFADAAQADLLDRGFDVGDMPKVQRRLNDLKSGAFDKPFLAGHLNEFEKIRKRINRNRSLDPAENAALNSLKRSMDDFLDDQFDNAAIVGDPEAIGAWRKARAAHAQWKKNFFEDKAIRNMIEREATPEEIRQWVMGATALSARKEAALTIRRMKQVLGDDHPSIRGLQADFLYEVAEPLLKAQPDFKQFVRNYDTIIRRNPSIVKALGLKESSMQPVFQLAKAQAGLPAGTVATLDLYRAMAQFMTGHQISKAGLRVRLTEAAFRTLAGADRVTQKQLLYQLSGAMYGDVAIPSKSAIAAQFIAGTALKTIGEQAEE